MYNTKNIDHEGEEEEETVEDIVAAFRAYCQPKRNTVFERHQFWVHPMTQSITTEKYVT